MKGILAAATLLLVACSGSTTPSPSASMTPDGVVRFGTTNPGTDCNHTPWATTFPPGSQVYWWAGFRERLPGGTAIVAEASLDGDVFEAETLTIPSGGADCMTRQDPTGGVIGGGWKVRLLFGGTVEAEGSFTVQ